MEDSTPTDVIAPTHSERVYAHSFNYCFWAKLIVAIPAIPLVAIAAASLFSDPLIKVLMGGAAALAAVSIAIWIDKQPCLSRMVCTKQKK